MQRGYFDDFKQLRATQGRVFEPDAKLTLAREATSIPSLQVTWKCLFSSPHISIWGCC